MEPTDEELLQLVEVNPLLAPTISRAIQQAHAQQSEPLPLELPKPKKRKPSGSFATTFNPNGQAHKDLQEMIEDEKQELFHKAATSQLKEMTRAGSMTQYSSMQMPSFQSFNQASLKPRGKLNFELPKKATYLCKLLELTDPTSSANQMAIRSALPPTDATKSTGQPEMKALMNKSTTLLNEARAILQRYGYDEKTFPHASIHYTRNLLTKRMEVQITEAERYLKKVKEYFSVERRIAQNKQDAILKRTAYLNNLTEKMAKQETATSRIFKLDEWNTATQHVITMIDKDWTIIQNDASKKTILTKKDKEIILTAKLQVILRASAYFFLINDLDTATTLYYAAIDPRTLKDSNSTIRIDPYKIRDYKFIETIFCAREAKYRFLNHIQGGQHQDLLLQQINARGSRHEAADRFYHNAFVPIKEIIQKNDWTQNNLHDITKIGPYTSINLPKVTYDALVAIVEKEV